MDSRDSMASTLFELYVIALFASALCIGLAAAYLVWRTGDSEGDGRRWLLGFLGAAACWSTTYGLQLAVSAVETKLFWARWVSIWKVVAVVAWVVFVLEYTGNDRWLRARRLAPIMAIPATAIPMAWTNPSGLVWTAVGTVEVAGTDLLHLENGPWFLLVGVYLYALWAVAFVVLSYLFATSRSLQRGQAGVLLLAAAVPWVGNAVYWAWGDTWLLVNITPLLFALTGILVVVAVARFRLLDVVPVPTRAVLAELEDAVAVVDGDDRLLYLNAEGRGLFENAEVGDPVSLILPDGRPDSDGPGTEVRLRRQGELRYFDLRRAGLTDSRDRTIGEMLVFRDITDRKRREQSLAEYKTIFERISDAVYVLDADGTVRLVNEPLAELLGQTPGEIVGTHASVFVADDGYERARDRLADLRESETGDGTVELVLEDANGREIPCETHLSLLSAAETEGGIVGVIRDVSERLQREQQVAVLNRVLRHNLRNDMNVILGQLERLSATLDSEHLDETADIDVARDHAEGLLDMADKARTAEELLDRSVRTVTTAVSAVLAGPVATLRTEFPAASVELAHLPDVQIHVHESVDVALEAILENAVEHNDRASPMVAVSVETREDVVAIEIADDGPGIPDNELAVLTAGRETQLEHGSGLGLWLAHWLVTRSGGDLTARERDPRGAVVTVTLPLADAAEDPQLETP